MFTSHTQHATQKNSGALQRVALGIIMSISLVLMGCNKPAEPAAKTAAEVTSTAASSAAAPAGGTGKTVEVGCPARKTIIATIACPAGTTGVYQSTQVFDSSPEVCAYPAPTTNKAEACKPIAAASGNTSQAPPTK